MVYLIVNGCCKVYVTECTKEEVRVIIQALESSGNDIQLKRVVK